MDLVLVTAPSGNSNPFGSTSPSACTELWIDLLLAQTIQSNLGIRPSNAVRSNGVHLHANVSLVI